MQMNSSYANSIFILFYYLDEVNLITNNALIKFKCCYYNYFGVISS